jgi:uncharacterized membrane protein
MMQHRSVGPIAALALVFLLGSQVVPAAPGGQIGVLYAGEPSLPPFYMMIPDPLFDISFVDAHVHASGPLDTSQVHRMIRLYMPRTVESLAYRFDVVVLFCATQDALGIRYTEMISRSVREAGVGLFMSGSQEGFGGFQSKPSWGGTAVGELLPVEVVPEGRNLVGRLVLDEPGHELISSIPWDMKDPLLASPGTWSHNLVTNKPGAHQLAHTVHLGAMEPLLVTWEVAEQTRVFALTSEIHRLSQGVVNPWRYHYDLASNLMIYLDYRPVPQDVEIVSRARSRILQISLRRTILFDLLEFSESFGADTGKILSKIEEVDGVISQAHQEYLELRYGEMLESCEPIEVMIRELEQQAVELKNQALIWVYAVEWLAVTGTALFCGFILWTIMVQRRLYKEVRVTKAK